MNDYKEKQKEYRDKYKNRGRVFWVSVDKSQSIIKGRTYIKPNKDKKKNNNGDK